MAMEDITIVKIQGEGWSVTYTGGDVLSVPNAPGNRHYQEVQDWIAVPNTPDAEFSVAERQTTRKAEVNELRTDKLSIGFVHVSHTYSADTESRASLASYVANVNAANGLPVGFTWRSVANVDIAFDATTILDLHNSMTDFLDATYDNSWTHKTNIDAEVTVAAVDAYDITTGWPT